MIEEAREYVRNLCRDVNRIYGYLAQVTIAKTQHRKMEFSVISVDSYPTMVLNEREPTGMWEKKSTQSAPETKCNTRRVGDALAHSIKRMIRDNTPEERKKPTTPSGQTEILGIAWEAMNIDTNEPWKGTLWKDGVKTHIQAAQKIRSAGLAREQNYIMIDAKDKLTKGKSKTPGNEKKSGKRTRDDAGTQE